MALFASYADLQTGMDDWAHRTVTTARKQECIRLAEDQLRRDLRVREMESSVALTISAQTLALPTGFVGMRRLYLATDPIAVLEYLPPDDFWRRYLSSTTGQPKAYTIEGENLVFGPSPDTTYTGRALIYALTSIATTLPTLFVNHAGLYLFGSLRQYKTFASDINDARIALWDAAYKEAMESVMKSNERDRYAGQLTVRPDQYA